MLKISLLTFRIVKSVTLQLFRQYLYTKKGPVIQLEILIHCNYGYTQTIFVKFRLCSDLVWLIWLLDMAIEISASIDKTGKECVVIAKSEN